MNFKNLKGVAVYVEKRKTRTYVGALYRDKSHYIFKYEDRYLRSRRSLPLGPELPLTCREFHSEDLFESFKDRIPDRDNPAYVDYCRVGGIDFDESDFFVLLVSIGRRGPSSFVFEPIFKEDFSNNDVKIFREKLGLNQREFSACFEVPLRTLIRIEGEGDVGRECIRRIRIYAFFPTVALEQLERFGGVLLSDKRILVEQKLNNFRI